MKKNEIISKVGSHIFMVIAIIHAIFILFVIASIFVFIWYESDLAIKMFATGLIGIMLNYFAYMVVYKIISDIVEKKINESSFDSGKGRFNQKLEQMMKEREANSNQ